MLLAVQVTFPLYLLIFFPFILYEKQMSQYKKLEYEDQIREKKYFFIFRRNKFLYITDIKLQITITSTHDMDQIAFLNSSFSQSVTILSRPSSPKYSMVPPSERQGVSSAASYYPLDKENNQKKTYFQPKPTNSYYPTPPQTKGITQPIKINLNATVKLEPQNNGTRKQQSSISPSQKQAIKPKIQFSYHRDNSNNQKDRKKGALSLNNKEDIEPRLSLNEFDLVNKRSKEQKRSKLALSSNILNYVYLGMNETKKETSSSQVIDKSSQSGIPTKCSGTSGTSINSNSYFQEHQNRLKMPCAKNTQSFLGNNRRSGFPREKKQIKSNQKQSHQQNQFNLSCSSKRPSLMDKLQSSKNLKKTVFLNNYDFGGIFLQKNSSIDQTVKPPFREKAIKQSTDHKWKNMVKCLVQQQNQTQNLKQSIHCGPQIRLQKYNCALLDKLGRNIAESFIPADD